MQAPIIIDNLFMLTPKIRNVVSWIPAISAARGQGMSYVDLGGKHLKAEIV